MSDMQGIKNIRAIDWLRAALYGILKGTGDRESGTGTGIGGWRFPLAPGGRGAGVRGNREMQHQLRVAAHPDCFTADIFPEAG